MREDCIQWELLHSSGDSEEERWDPMHLERHIWVKCLYMTPMRDGSSGYWGLYLFMSGVWGSMRENTLIQPCHIPCERLVLFYGQIGEVLIHIYHFVRLLHLYISDASIFHYIEADWLLVSPSCTCCLFHPQTWCMMDLAIVGYSWRSDIASRDITLTVMIEGWLVSWTRRQFSITAG